MKSSILIAIIIILSCNLTYCIDGKGSVMSGGAKRTFDYHAPGASIGINLPVMIIMHGDDGTGAGMKGERSFDAESDANNFIAVYPDAVNGNWNRNADNVPGDACTGSDNPYDDVLFISDLIDYLCATYHININKVFATGHSAGSYMTYNLAIQLSGRIAAIAPVSGDLCGDYQFINDALSVNPPMPIYHIHGDQDKVISGGADYPDPDFTPNYEWPLTEFSTANCKSDSYVSSANIVAGVVEHVYCAEPKKISLIQIVGGGHGWPNVPGYNAENAIVKFCLSHSLNLGTSCEPNSVEEQTNSILIDIKPNPTTGQFKITSLDNINNVRVYDVLGDEISITKIDEKSYSLNSATTGVYILIVSLSNGQQTVKKLIVE